MFKSDISTWVCGIIIGLIVIGLIMVLMGKGSTRESFASKASTNKPEADLPTCKSDEYLFCTQKSGSNVACGCLKSQGGYNDKFDRTNVIACGENGGFVCNYVKRPDGQEKIGCGCINLVEKDNPVVILPERFIK